jgi:membrane carboxypeptidase/penicillin-binding protein
LRRGLWGVLALLVLVAGSYTVDVIVQRRATRALVDAALAGPGIVLRLSDLSPRQKEILLAVEDPRFYSHHGIDLSTPGAGLTTITQGLVKIHYFAHFRPGAAKIRQSLLARFALDPVASKDEQLTLYINELGLGTVDGRPVCGFAAAAQAYYGKSFAALNEDEYLSLVAMPIAPTVFNLREHPERNANRVAAIKRVLSGAYAPRGVMDQYYGGETFRPERGRLRALYDRWIWGY